MVRAGSIQHRAVSSQVQTRRSLQRQHAGGVVVGHPRRQQHSHTFRRLRRQAVRANHERHNLLRRLVVVREAAVAQGRREACEALNAAGFKIAASLTLKLLRARDAKKTTRRS